MKEKIQAGSIADIDVGDVVDILFMAKKFIIVGAMLVGGLFLLISFTLPEKYESKIILVPAGGGDASSHMAGLFGQVGSLASLAGVNIDGTGSREVVALEVMKTWGFIEAFISSNDIAPEVVAVVDWDEKSGELQYKSSFDPSTRSWSGGGWAVGGGINGKPKSWDVYKKFKKNMSIVQDSKSGLITIRLKHYSPHLAKEWLELLVDSVNEYFRERDKSKAISRISYLQEKAVETSVAEMKSVFYELIEEQIKTLMLAEASDEYVFEVVSAPKVAEEKVGPGKLVLVLAGVILGIIISAAVVILKFATKLNE